MTAALRSVAYFVSGRIALPRPYVCGSCPQIRRSLPAAIYREFTATNAIKCRCGQRMHPIQPPSYPDFRVETSR